MKKAITVFMILFALCLINMGCGGKIPPQIKDNLSEVRVNIYEFSNDNMSVNIITGEREDPYVLDGTAKGMTEYTVITMIPENPDNISAEITYNYLLKTGKKDYSGSFSMHPFGNSYAAEIGEKIDVKSVQLSVNATKDDWNFEENVVLESILTNEMIDWEEALLIGADSLKDATASMYDKKTLKAEVYVKLLCDPLGKTSDHFWYVAFADGKKIVSALIDPISKEILALKEE
ncbi:MAG TPA: hypothetical protein GX745_06965 [Clostridiales bacterium]|jgi:hypothetical protein|nr:hypothetical protein [Clostridiales bacterium]